MIQDLLLNLSPECIIFKVWEYRDYILVVTNYILQLWWIEFVLKGLLFQNLLLQWHHHVDQKLICCIQQINSSRLMVNRWTLTNTDQHLFPSVLGFVFSGFWMRFSHNPMTIRWVFKTWPPFLDLIFFGQKWRILLRWWKVRISLAYLNQA